jgi:glycosyltransferase involved in cell wall biosynthesis
VSDGVASVEWCDVVIALKPWPGSLDRALQSLRSVPRALVLDVDDPDFEARFGPTRRTQFGVFASMALRRRLPTRFYRLRWRAARIRHTLISNPGLARWYRGVVVPHARSERPAGRDHSRTSGLRIAFVGTPRPFKGLAVLREAARRMGDVELTITAEPPSDAASNEAWVGETSLSYGLEIVDDADIVVIPSVPSPYSDGQLPVKLIDAMMSGRAVIASDFIPIRWALGDTGILVPPGDSDALVSALASLRSPDVRKRLGVLARRRALEVFTPQAVAPVLARSVAAALASVGPRPVS